MVSSGEKWFLKVESYLGALPTYSIYMVLFLCKNLLPPIIDIGFF